MWWCSKSGNRSCGGSSSSSDINSGSSSGGDIFFLDGVETSPLLLRLLNGLFHQTRMVMSVERSMERLTRKNEVLEANLP
jgi:hypothetical protein